MGIIKYDNVIIKLLLIEFRLVNYKLKAFSYLQKKTKRKREEKPVHISKRKIEKKEDRKVV